MLPLMLTGNSIIRLGMLILKVLVQLAVFPRTQDPLKPRFEPWRGAANCIQGRRGSSQVFEQEGWAQKK